MRLGALACALLALVALGCRKPPPYRAESPRLFTVGQPAAPRTLIAAGSGTCAKRKDGFWCWGQLGDDESRVRPTRMPWDDVVEVALGGSHFCLLKTDRTVACAGRNLDGELGDGRFANRTTLAPVRGLANVLHIAAGSYETCAIVADAGKQQVFCFGTDEAHDARVAEPTRIGELDDARELAVEWGLACARRADGSVWCWGSDDYGQLGNGSPPRYKRGKPTSVPVRVLLVNDAVGVVAGGFGACVLGAGGNVGCWGHNSYGAVGDGTSWQRDEPVGVVGLGDVAQVAKGGFGHACARRRNGTVWCWGYGIGERATAKTPAAVPSLADATDIAAGHTHVCARRKDGSVACWGNNSEHQLGDGTTMPAREPREVLGPE